MNLTEEQLKEVEAMAGLFFTVEDICTVLELDAETVDYLDSCMSVKNNHPFVKAYFAGRLSAEVQLRTAIKQAAMNGSNPAQSTMIDYFNKSRV
jgi:hypothetical protein